MEKMNTRAVVDYSALLSKAQPRVIQTERGVGYTFALPVEPF